MKNSQQLPGAGVKKLMASTAAFVVAFAVAAADVDAQRAPVPMPNPGAQQQELSSGFTFEQRVGQGMLYVMSEEDKQAVPAEEWRKFMPSIIASEQYSEVPKNKEAEIGVSFFYNTPFYKQGNAILSNLVEGLIETGQLADAGEKIRHSITPQMLTKKAANGYIHFVDILRHKAIDQLSPATQAALLADTELWMIPVAVYPAEGAEAGKTPQPQSEKDAPAIMAVRHGLAGQVTEKLQQSIAAHPRWSDIKMTFLLEAVETRQMDKLTGPLLDTYTDDDILHRDSVESNMVDRASLTGQAHLLPEKFWISAGLTPFVTPHPKTGIMPLHFIVGAADTVRGLTEAQKSVLRKATREHWFHMGREQHGISSFLLAMTNKRGDLLNEEVWKGLTRKDLNQNVGGGLYTLGDWIKNAGYGERIKHHYAPDEYKRLAPEGSINSDPASWAEIKIMEDEFRQGIFDHDKWMKTNPVTGRTNLHTWLRMIPAAEMVEKILPRFSLDDLMVAGKDPEFGLLSVADGGFLKYLSRQQWDEIRKRSEVMTQAGRSGRFVLLQAAKDINRQQLGDIPKDVLAAQPRNAWFQRDSMLGFPFHWAHWSGQEESIPWETGLFRPHDLMIIAPMKADSFTHLAARDMMMRAKGILKPGEAGPLAKMLKRFPFETWREKDDFKDTAILKLARNGGFHYLPGTEKKAVAGESRQQQEQDLASNSAIYLLPKKEFLDRIEASDLEARGRFDDTPLDWLAPSTYVEIKGSAVVWHPALELFRPEAVDAISLDAWMKRAKPAQVDDIALQKVLEETDIVKDRDALEKRGIMEQIGIGTGVYNVLRQENFPALAMVEAGYLPPEKILQAKEFYTKRDGGGSDAVRELYRQKKLTVERLNDLADLGLLTEDVVPRYVLMDFKNTKSWLYQAPGDLHTVFAKAAAKGQADAADWGDTMQAVLQSIPAETWYMPGPGGVSPVMGMIVHGKALSVPDNILYESPRMWTAEMLQTVFGDDSLWRDNPYNLKNLWKNQTGFIESELRDMPERVKKTAAPEEKARLAEYEEMLKSRSGMYESFRPVFEKTHQKVIEAMPVPKPREKQELPFSLDNIPPAPP